MSKLDGVVSELYQGVVCVKDLLHVGGVHVWGEERSMAHKCREKKCQSGTLQYL